MKKYFLILLVISITEIWSVSPDNAKFFGSDMVSVKYSDVIAEMEDLDVRQTYSGKSQSGILYIDYRADFFVPGTESLMKLVCLPEGDIVYVEFMSVLPKEKSDWKGSRGSVFLDLKEEMTDKYGTPEVLSEYTGASMGGEYLWAGNEINVILESNSDYFYWDYNSEYYQFDSNRFRNGQRSRQNNIFGKEFYVMQRFEHKANIKKMDQICNDYWNNGQKVAPQDARRRSEKGLFQRESRKRMF